MSTLTRPLPSPRTAHAADGNAHAAAPTLKTASGQPTPGRKPLELVELLGDAQGIDIAHNGHLYRLQITKAGKLILTK